MPRLPDQDPPPDDGGGAAERLRQFEQARGLEPVDEDAEPDHADLRETPTEVMEPEDDDA